jgi:hypothetical protein
MPDADAGCQPPDAGQAARPPQTSAAAVRSELAKKQKIYPQMRF